MQFDKTVLIIREKGMLTTQRRYLATEVYDNSVYCIIFFFKTVDDVQLIGLLDEQPTDLQMNQIANKYFLLKSTLWIPASSINGFP